MSAVCGFAKLPSIFVEEVMDGEVVSGQEVQSRKNLRDFLDNPAIFSAMTSIKKKKWAVAL